ncbi:MAG: tripartite tricarboxylate transporter substrate binding protein [Pseudomonadota bacterium]
MSTIKKTRALARARELGTLCVLLCAVMDVSDAQPRVKDNSGAYPTRPVRVIVPYSPGGSSDTVARILAAKFAETLGQQFVIDNRPGASGSLGREIVAKATPDGYTLLIGDSPHTINVHVLRHVPYHPIRDFTPVSLLAAAPQVMVIHPGFAAKNLKEFIAAAAAQPGKLNYGSGGHGSITQFTGELFKMAARVDVAHVPYKSIAIAMTEVIGGQIPAAFPTLPGAVPHIKAGRLRGLGVTAAKRVSALPDVPTFDESGVSGMLVANWFGLFGPARLPKDIVTRLHQSTVDVLSSQDGRAKFGALSLDIIASTPQAFDTYLRAELEKWGKVVKAAGIKPE